jgi:Skp family chaperone for outer membrane proteins
MTPAPTPRRLARPIVIALLLVGMGTVAFRSGASYSAGAPTVAPIVAMVNVEQVVNDCVETTTRNAANDAKYKPDIDQLKKMEEQMTTINSEAKLLAPDNRAGRRDLLLKRSQIEGQYKAKSNFLQSAIDEEKADVIRDVYTKAVAAIADYAAANGIALVMVDDTVLNVPSEGGMGPVTSAIIGRRILYADKAKLDITADVLTKMNNDFAATGGKAPAKAKK